MSIAHEKELHINENGVYPVVKKLPSPLCCFKVMHIRTGTLWIAYCEIMWIVSQCSFWTAESIVREAFPPYLIIAGFTFTCIQLVLVFFLIQGIRTFRLAYIEVYMIGVCCRIFMFLSFFLTLLFFFIVTDEDERTNSSHFFHRFLIVKIIFTCVYTLLKAYALYTAYRCYSYIAKTRRAIAHLTLFEDPTSDPIHFSHVQRLGSSHSTFRSMLPSNHECRLYGCRICDTSATPERRDVLGKPCHAKQISEISHLQCSPINRAGG
ncbi:uncharacterized protein CELE_C11E4.8 [Caenorhabditis elegans]|nr:Transmembrane protein [Caenorhabditis elegans]VTW47444.1 Transmembrane protein [Caenorhabditis elegans]